MTVPDKRILLVVELLQTYVAEFNGVTFRLQ